MTRGSYFRHCGDCHNSVCGRVHENHCPACLSKECKRCQRERAVAIVHGALEGIGL